MPLDAFRVRQANTHDLSALGRMGAQLMRTHFAFDSQRFMAPPVDAEEGYGWFLGTQMEAPDGVVFVAERDDRVIGYAYAALEPLNWKELRDAAGFIHDVYVEEAARGAGVAVALVEACVEWLRSRGAPRVLLWTAAPNAAAQRLFERLGFRHTMIEMTRETPRDA
jgi:GNAT superfamily N-acetyltransferase